MASAGMCYDNYPAASADDALDRQSIVRLSVQRAAERFGERFTFAVYIGDGVWDAHACRTLGIPFIGIGSGDRAVRLASEGAVRVFEGFSDGDLLLESVNEIANAV
jgi:phosphoglycolate phosphatase-like HAD superfamily hydrolase